MATVSIMRLLRDSVWVALALGLGLLPALAGKGVPSVPPSFDMLVLFGVLLVCTFVVEGLDHGDSAEGSSLWRTMLAVLAASVVLFFLYSGSGVLWRHETQALAVLLWFALLRGGCILVSSYWRIFPSLSEEVLVLGNPDGVRAVRELVDGSDGRYRIKAVIPCAAGVPAGDAEDDARKVDWLVERANKEKVRTIVVSLSERRGAFPVDAVLRCRMMGVRVLDAAAFYERVTRKLNVENITPSWLIFASGFDGSRWRDAVKRTSDVLLAFMALAMVGPFMPFVALAVRLDSPGPVFFRQVRVGRGGRPFVIFKFRTMRDGAEKDTGPVWARANDSRVTALGAFLRRCRIDELPQLFNVLRGEMSFIGPRPERPEFVADLVREVPFYAERHAVKPGLTGWAQVCFPYGASREDALEKLRYDLYYIKNRSLALDAEILVRTVSVVLLGSGAR